MANGVNLLVGGKIKSSLDINYLDLVLLYKEYTEKHGSPPTGGACLSKNNLPQQRIVSRILQSEGITYNEFLNQFGKVSHVRSSIKNYDKYISIYTEKSKLCGHPLTASELENNNLGLPSLGWLINNCNDPTVNSLDDFIRWCGLIPPRRKWNKDEVAKVLIDLQGKLNRPIIGKDITFNKTGFSMIVINRLWGGLNNCKDELGLMPTEPNKPLPFNYYKEKLDSILNDISKRTDRKFITWNDIENNAQNISHTGHKVFTKAFTGKGMDVFAYIKSFGLEMNPSNFSFHKTFADGERVLSSYEYDFSNYLRQLGYVYNKDYFKDVRYIKFVESLGRKSKMTCDYVVNNKYIEIAGMIQVKNGDLKKYESIDKISDSYKEGLIYKKNLLEKNGLDYLFLYPEDFYSGEYKSKFLTFINKAA